MLRNISKYHIDMDVKGEDGFQWRFTGVYGEAQHGQKHKTWEDLRNLRVTPIKPWLCAGDFNEILLAHEKEGGRPKSQSDMDRFRDVLEECQLHDLGFEGDIFTWRNHSHNAKDYIRERLDRAVANDLWRGHFPSARVIHGDPRHSDHRPLIMVTDRPPDVHAVWSMGKPFRFEASWLAEEKCAEVVADSWKAAMDGGTASVHEAVMAVAGSLSNWSHNILGDMEKRVKKLKKELEHCRKSSISQDQVAREEILKYKLEKV